MKIIPTSPIPSQFISVTLAGQQCQIEIETKATGLFCNLFVNGSIIIGGVICLNTVLIVRDLYLGFIGDLTFYDLQGESDPVYTGLGTRYVLAYVEASEILR